jgi:PAS domain S-box-containing protein
MPPPRRLCGALLLLALLLAGPSPAWAAELVRIGVLANRGFGQCHLEWDSTAEYLTNALPGRRFAIVPLTFADVPKAVAKGEVEFIICNSAMYVELEIGSNVTRIATLKNSVLGRGITLFGGVIFFKADRNDIRGINDLRGLRFMAANEASLGGWRAAYGEIKRAGLDPYRDFKELRFGQQHDEVVYAVAKGEVDAGTVRTDVLESLAKAGAIRLSDFRIIPHAHAGPDYERFPFLLSTRLYPEWPIAKVAHTPDDVARSVAGLLLTLPEDSLAARSAKVEGWTIPLSYEPVHELLKYLRLSPYENYGTITLAEAVRQYWLSILATLVFCAALTATTVRAVRLNARLRQSEASYRLLAEESPVSIMAFDADGVITFVNRWHIEAFARHAVGEDFFLGRTVTELPGIASAGLQPEVARILKGERLSIDEAFIPRFTNGRSGWQSLRGAPLLREGKVAGGVLIRDDVTARKQAEAALVESEDKFRNAFEHSAFGMALIDAGGRYLQVNRSYCAMLGYEPDELLAKTYIDITHPEDVDLSRAFVASIDGGKGYGSLEKRYLRKDGRIVWVALSTAAVRGPGGAIKFYVSQFQDITGRKSAQEELALYKTVIDSAHEAVVVADPDGNILAVNPAFERLFKLPFDEARKATLADLYPPDSARSLDEAMTPALARGDGFEGVLDAVDAEGRRFPLWQRAGAVYGAGGRILFIFSFMHDHTQSKRLQDELLRARDEAFAASRAKSEFLANMSHEIRTPLTGVVGMIELTLQSQLTNEQRSWLGMADDAAGNLLRIINDILDYSKIEAGRLSIEPMPFALRATVRKTANLLAATAKAKGLALSVVVADDVPDRLSGDPLRIEQVLINLIGNAVKFTSRGGIEIAVGLDAAQDKEPAGDRVLRFSVRDTGIGIEHEDIPRLFQLFGQLDSSKAKRFQGTGLGLAICKRLTEMMGGRIWVESEPGRGSTFFFTVATREEAPAAQGQAAAGSPDLPPLRVLLVEDNQINRAFIQRLLGKAGHSVTSALDGREAVAALRAQDFDLVLMDIQLPHMDGDEVARRIRKGEAGGRNADIPIVALTAYAMPGDRERFLEAGMNGYVSKPVERDELFRAMAKAAQARPRQTPAPPDGILH